MLDDFIYFNDQMYFFVVTSSSNNVSGTFAVNVSSSLASSHSSLPSFPLVLLRFFLLLSFIFLDPVKIFDSMGYGSINASSYAWPLVRTTTCISLLTSHHSSIPPSISSSPSFRLFSPSFHTGYTSTCFLYTSLPFSPVLFPSPSAPLTVSPSPSPPPPPSPSLY